MLLDRWPSVAERFREGDLEADPVTAQLLAYFASRPSLLPDLRQAMRKTGESPAGGRPLAG